SYPLSHTVDPGRPAAERRASSGSIILPIPSVILAPGDIPAEARFGPCNSNNKAGVHIIGFPRIEKPISLSRQGGTFQISIQRLGINRAGRLYGKTRSEEHTSELQSRGHLV